MTENIITTVSNQDNNNEVTLPIEKIGTQTQSEPEATQPEPEAEPTQAETQPDAELEDTEAETTQTSEAQAPPKRKRKSKAELLEVKLAKRAELDIKIESLQKELDETTQKTRNRGLVLVGIVVEQCIKNKTFETEPAPTLDMTWWHEQAKLLPPKDQGAYTKFLKTLENCIITK